MATEKVLRPDYSDEDVLRDWPFEQVSIQKTRDLCPEWSFNNSRYFWLKIEKGFDPFAEIRQHWPEDNKLHYLHRQHEEPRSPTVNELDKYYLYLILRTFQFGNDRCRIVTLYVGNNRANQSRWTSGVSGLFCHPEIMSGCPFVVFDLDQRRDVHGVDSSIIHNSVQGVTHFKYEKADCSDDVLRRVEGSKMRANREIIDCYPWSMEDFLTGKLPANLQLDDLVGAVMAVRARYSWMCPRE